MLHSVLDDVHSAPWFAVMADEATNVSIDEQLCLTIIWINNNNEISENPIGLIEELKTDDTTLTSALKDVLIQCVLPLSSWRGKAYDGVANMSGHLGGVATHIKSDEPAAVHMQGSARICILVKDTLTLMMELVKLIKFLQNVSTF